MPEPAIRVLFFSDLFGSFTDADGGRADSEYQRLIDRGMEIVFVSGAPLRRALQALDGLQPEAPVIAADGCHCSPDHALAPAFASLSARLASPRHAVEELLAILAAGGDHLITVGIGNGADDTFLASLQLSAAIGGAEDVPAAPGLLYECRARGVEGWNEWAAQMTRRIKVILTREEMRVRDFNGDEGGAGIE